MHVATAAPSLHMFLNRIIAERSKTSMRKLHCVITCQAHFTHRFPQIVTCERCGKTSTRSNTFGSRSSLVNLSFFPPVTLSFTHAALGFKGKESFKKEKVCKNSLRRSQHLTSKAASLQMLQSTEGPGHL